VCGAREAEEETGVQVGPVRFVGVTNDVFEPEGKHYVTLWFEAERESGEAAPVARDELDAVGWFHEDDLPEPLFPPLVKLLEGRTLA
jgi:8-oxo-dGTP diphosphatase